MGTYILGLFQSRIRRDEKGADILKGRDGGLFQSRIRRKEKGANIRMKGRDGEVLPFLPNSKCLPIEHTIGWKRSDYCLYREGVLCRGVVSFMDEKVV